MRKNWIFPSLLVIWTVVLQWDRVTAVIKMLPKECQEHEMNPVITLAELSNCLEAAPKDAAKTCIKMCVLHNRGILDYDTVSDDGIDAFVEDSFPFHTWDRIKRGLKSCTTKYVEDDNDASCTKSERYTNCLEDVQDSICAEKPPENLPEIPDNAQGPPADDYSQGPNPPSPPQQGQYQQAPGGQGQHQQAPGGQGQYQQRPGGQYGQGQYQGQYQQRPGGQYQGQYQQRPGGQYGQGQYQGQYQQRPGGQYAQGQYQQRPGGQYAQQQPQQGQQQQAQQQQGQQQQGQKPQQGQQQQAQKPQQGQQQQAQKPQQGQQQQAQRPQQGQQQQGQRQQGQQQQGQYQQRQYSYYNRPGWNTPQG